MIKRRDDTIYDWYNMTDAVAGASRGPVDDAEGEKQKENGRNQRHVRKNSKNNFLIATLISFKISINKKLCLQLTHFLTRFVQRMCDALAHDSRALTNKHSIIAFQAALKPLVRRILAGVYGVCLALLITALVTYLTPACTLEHYEGKLVGHQCRLPRLSPIDAALFEHCKFEFEIRVVDF